jgi:acetolactate synthase I/II/III large subunit
VISSVNARRELGSGDGRLHELPSQRGVFAGLTAFSHTLLDAADLPQVLARAFAVFASERPRPVHIEIPLDVIVAPASNFPHAPLVRPTRPAPDAKAVAAAASRLAAAKRPLILAGGGAAHAGQALRTLAERLQAPVALTINAKGLLPPRHPLLLGSTQSLPQTRALVRDADVVLAIGTELGETDYDVVFDGGFAIDGQLIRIDIDAAQLMRNFRPDVAVVGDAGEALSGLVAALDRCVPHAAALTTTPGTTSATPWGAARVAAARAAIESGYDAATRAQAMLIDTLAAALPGVIVAGDSTSPVYVGNYTYDASAPRTWFNSSTGYGTLGYGLPAAIGAKLAAPARPVVCLIGDGGLQFTLPELASAVEARVPVIVVVWNNEGYGEIRKYMTARDITPVGVDPYTPDFVMLARGFGCAARTVATPAALAEALEDALAFDAPTVIEIREANWFAQVDA